jgi:predicted DNA-binding transcriptional regulator AlpA
MLELLTRDELAAELGLAPSSINRLVKSGALPPPIRLGYKTLRWRLSDLRNHLAAAV